MYCGECGKELIEGVQKFCTACGASIIPDSSSQVPVTSQIDSPAAASEPEGFEPGHYALGSNLKRIRLWDGEGWSGPVFTDSDYAIEVLGLVESLHNVPPRYADESTEDLALTEDELGLQAIGVRSSSSRDSGIDWQGIKDRRSAPKPAARQSQSVRCVKCAAMNPPAAQFCNGCASPLIAEAAPRTYVPERSPQVGPLQSQYAWLLAFTPILFTIIDMFMWQNFQTSTGVFTWLLYFGINSLLAKLDGEELERCNLEIQFWLGAFLVPFYLWKRAKITDGNQIFLIVWLVTTFLTLAIS